MKNLIDPKKLEELKSGPVNYQDIEDFLAKEKTITGGSLCRVLGVPPSSFYSWKNRKLKAMVNGKEKEVRPLSEVTPTGGNKRQYSGSEKVKLLRDYQRLDDGKKAVFLRRYGIYNSDIERWRQVADQAAVESLEKKKQGKSGKTEDQIKIEELSKEIQGHEKVISKLSTLVVLQKKISDIMGLPDSI